MTHDDQSLSPAETDHRTDLPEAVIETAVAEPLGEQLVVTHLDGRHRRHVRPSGEGRRHPGVVGEPVEGRQFAVGQRAQKVDDRLLVGPRVSHVGEGIRRHPVPSVPPYEIAR